MKDIQAAAENDKQRPEEALAAMHYGRALGGRHVRRALHGAWTARRSGVRTGSTIMEFRLEQADEGARAGSRRSRSPVPFTTPQRPAVREVREDQKAAFGFRAAAHRHLNPARCRAWRLDDQLRGCGDGAVGAVRDWAWSALTPTIHLEADFLAPIHPGQWVDLRCAAGEEHADDELRGGDGRTPTGSRCCGARLMYRKPRDDEDPAMGTNHVADPCGCMADRSSLTGRVCCL